MKRLVGPLDFTVEETLELLEPAGQIALDSSPYAKVYRGKILATLSYEPNTHTRLSFESAMLRLGGSVLGFASMESSSVSKGESVADIIRAASYYTDICVIRHPKEGAPLVASHYSGVPVINVDDGRHRYPTQMLTDLMVIRRKRGHLDQMTIGLCGDLKFRHTVHSLIKFLVRFGDIRFVLISPEELHVPDCIMQDVLPAHSASYREVETLKKATPELDILYMTCIQKECFFNEEDYVHPKDSRILTTDKLHAAKNDLVVLHPLPRVNEITMEVDSDPRATYFEQAQNGAYVRMALILKLSEVMACWISIV